MGPEAFRLVDFLKEAKQSIWQILPLNPTDLIHYNSPYHSTSAFAGNPLLISPELLAQDGLLTKSDINQPPDFPADHVDFPNVVPYKEKLLARAYERFKQRQKANHEFADFLEQHSDWLDDFALFITLKAHFHGKMWSEWPVELKDRHPNALQSATKEFDDQIRMAKFFQFLFMKQWTTLKNRCNAANVQILGDIPIYVDYDSADVWTNPGLFKLDENKKPYVGAGVPPDYFSETGQLWGNPIYRWDVLKESGYDWWVRRIGHNLSMFNYVRIDHFRGLVAYWEVPASERTAINGRWIEAPAKDFLSHLARKFPCLPIVAEDLGVITPDVREIMQMFDLPGMKLLLFAFGPGMPENPYIPHNLVRNCIAYTGTHDNNTVKGWLRTEATPDDKKRLFSYLGREVTPDELPRELIRLVMMSVANLAIFPMQDLLGLDERGRMNRPAVQEGNWRWRMLPNQLTPELTGTLREMTEVYGRA
ncbi:MAG: 4-alpha-glucanotransferase [Candidatus Abyssubacteria bacterium]